MKKIMILAAAVGTTIFAHAASVDWYVKGSADTENYQVFIVKTISESWTSVADVMSDSQSLVNAGKSYDTIVKNGRVYSAYGTVNSASITKTDGMVNLVIVNGSDATEYYYVAHNLSNLCYDELETPPGQLDTTAADLLAGTRGTFAGAPVPEPSSALLMLLGMAGLALKRKRA